MSWSQLKVLLSGFILLGLFLTLIYAVRMLNGDDTEVVAGVAGSLVASVVAWSMLATLWSPKGK